MISRGAPGEKKVNNIFGKEDSMCTILEGKGYGACGARGKTMSEAGSILRTVEPTEGLRESSDMRAHKK